MILNLNFDLGHGIANVKIGHVLTFDMLKVLQKMSEFV